MDLRQRVRLWVSRTVRGYGRLPSPPLASHSSTVSRGHDRGRDRGKEREREKAWRKA